MKNPFIEGYGTTICKSCFDKFNAYHNRVSDLISLLRETIKNKEEKITQLKHDVISAEALALKKLGLKRIPEEHKDCACCDQG